MSVPEGTPGHISKGFALAVQATDRAPGVWDRVGQGSTPLPWLGGRDGHGVPGYATSKSGPGPVLQRKKQEYGLVFTVHLWKERCPVGL